MQTHRRNLLRGSAAALAGLTLTPVLAGCDRARGRGSSTPDASGEQLQTAAAQPDPEFSELKGFCADIPALDEGEYEDRRERARRALAEAGMDALVVEAGQHYSFFTGSRWGQSERPMLFVLPARGDAFWCSPSFEAPTLHSRMGEVATLVWHEHESPYETLRAGLEARGMSGARLALDPAMRLFVASGIMAAVPAARPAAEIFHAVRIVKTDRELARLRRANEATKAALQSAAARLVPGMTESEFSELVKQAQQAAGLEDIWVLALFGPNAAYPHGTEERRRACPSELVLVDTGGSLHGYQSDITRTWAFGEVPTAQQKAYATVLEAQREAMAMIRPGVRCGEVDARAREVMAKAGYGPHYQLFTHRLGHGIGIHGHEEPYLVRDNPLILQPGMTMSNEPGIYVQGSFGVRIEDIVAVTETGHEVFGPVALSLEQPFG